jgi:hypothetical protein
VPYQAFTTSYAAPLNAESEMAGSSNLLVTFHVQNLNCQLTVINADFKLQILSICICHLMLGPSFPPINYSIYFPLHLILPNQPSLLFFSFSLMHFFSSNHNLFSLIFSSHIPQFFPLFTTPINFMAPSHFLFVFFLIHSTKLPLHCSILLDVVLCGRYRLNQKG